MNRDGVDVDYIWLVVWNIFYFPINIGFLIIPTDFHIFQRGGPTTNQIYMVPNVLQGSYSSASFGACEGCVHLKSFFVTMEKKTTVQW